MRRLYLHLALPPVTMLDRTAPSPPTLSVPALPHPQTSWPITWELFAPRTVSETSCHLRGRSVENKMCMCMCHCCLATVLYMYSTCTCEMACVSFVCSQSNLSLPPLSLSLSLSLSHTHTHTHTHTLVHNSIATDDQYASNVPNNIKPNAVISDDEKLHPSQPSQSTMVTRARERAEEMNHREEKGTDLTTLSFLASLV